MAAKDYQICPALASAYIAKVSKRNPHQMLSDRREITEGEILMLIDWLLDQKWDDVEKDGGALCFESRVREGMVVEMKLVDKDKIQRLDEQG